MESESVRQNLSLIKIQNLPNRELLIKPRLETCNILCLIFVIMLNKLPRDWKTPWPGHLILARPWKRPTNCPEIPGDPGDGLGQNEGKRSFLTAHRVLLV